MIGLKMTIEFFQDILTPGVLSSGLECTAGIPKDAKFVGIGTIIENGATYIVAQFDDGKIDISHTRVIFERSHDK